MAHTLDLADRGLSGERSKVAVVTGGSRGLGKAMVEAFAAAGVHVVIASRKYDACDSLARSIEDRYGVRACAVEFNASSWADCDRLVERAYEAFDRIDVLVNNAGMSPHYDSLDSVTEAYFDKVIAVNLRGPFRLGAAFGSRMAAQGGGSIINVGSIEASRPQPRALPYAAAKAGLHALTCGFAQAFGPSVRANTIQAGAFLTDIAENWPPGLREEMERKVALGRCARPEEIVGTVMFLSSEASSYMTGANLELDGGWS